jgi:RimJ/RimL family protein N-acetyltransferase
MSELMIRPIDGPSELALFRSLPYVLNDELERDLAEGRRLADWLWVGLRDDRLVARAAWWTQRRGGDPAVLDVFDIADGAQPEDGTRLLRAAMEAVVPTDATPPDAIRFVPPDWREDESVRRGVDARVKALEATGARLLVERLRLQWDAGAPVTRPTGRLLFREPASREELVELMTVALEGTLDAHSNAELRHKSPEQVAAEQYDDEFVGYPSPSSWWRVANLPDGAPVGFVIPARNSYNPILAYIGVLPAHRGQGYVNDILAEGTRILVEAGSPRIRASTDMGNVPMARAFARAGYRTFERQLDLTWETL